MKQGAMDYVTKPLDTSRLMSALSTALKISELSSQNRQLQEYLLGTPLTVAEPFRDIVTASDKMQAIFKLIDAISPSRHPVFITGETGVGKELIARAVHRTSGLSGSFVPVNLAGLDPLMIDDTLFGHRKGAFTGASEHRDGLIAKAQGGTLFLDEIGDLGPQSQVKLLRLLQENEYYRIGSDLIQKSTARIVVASNRNFAALIERGLFREDLYHRLCCHRIHMPPLRERKEDIVPLVRHFSDKAAQSLGRPAPRISRELEYLLCEYDYPGNVRELANRVTNAVVMNPSGLLTQDDFPDLALDRMVSDNLAKETRKGHYSLHRIFPEFPTMAQIERVMIHEAIRWCAGRKGAAADLLGITRQTLRKKLEEAKADEE
jgi:DNA-binding NtrC family response regulator